MVCVVQAMPRPGLWKYVKLQLSVRRFILNGAPDMQMRRGGVAGRIWRRAVFKQQENPRKDYVEDNIRSVIRQYIAKVWEIEAVRDGGSWSYFCKSGAKRVPEKYVHGVGGVGGGGRMRGCVVSFCVFCRPFGRDAWNWINLGVRWDRLSVPTTLSGGEVWSATFGN